MFAAHFIREGTLPSARNTRKAPSAAQLLQQQPLEQSAVCSSDVFRRQLSSGCGQENLTILRRGLQFPGMEYFASKAMGGQRQPQKKLGVK